MILFTILDLCFISLWCLEGYLAGNGLGHRDGLGEGGRRDCGGLQMSWE